jgi:amidase
MIDEFQVNCLTEIFFVEAIDRAKKLDEARKAHPDAPLLPLHGLPISLKDSFKIQGVDSTIGYISLVNKPAEKASPLVQILLDLGAVLYCKTNVPQSSISLYLPALCTTNIE